MRQGRVQGQGSLEEAGAALKSLGARGHHEGEVGFEQAVGGLVDGAVLADVGGAKTAVPVDLDKGGQ